MVALVEARPAGLYCPAGDFWIDPTRGVPRAVITHAHGDHARSGSGHYWAAARGLELLRERIGFGSGVTALDYGQAITLGDARLSLHPAGHVLGSAQVRIEAAGEVWVVSGDYKRQPDPSCDPFEVVRCDTFVTETTFAVPDYAWPDPQQVAAEILAWWRDCKREGLTAVLACYALGKAQRILAELARLTDETVYLHAAMSRLVRAYRRAGIGMLPTEPLGAQVRHFDWRGRLLLAPPSALSTHWLRRFRPVSRGFASGWMQVAGSRRRQDWDRGFVLSDHVDWPGLLQTVEQTGARRVLAMHGHGETLVRHLRARGLEAATLAERPAGALDAAEEAAAGGGRRA